TSAVTVMNSTTITATFTIAAGATLGAQNVTVTTSGGISGAKAFTVEPAPTLASISPIKGVLGTSVPVTLTGTNFFTPATISFNGGTGITANSVTVTST